MPYFSFHHSEPTRKKTVQAEFFTTLVHKMKVLVATEKPFAKVAVDGIREVVESAGYELALLEKYTDKQQLLDAVSDADALIIRSDIVDAAVLDAAKKLKIVVRAGAGYDNIDLEAATSHGVVAMNTPGQNSNAVAELALGLMVFAVRNQGFGMDVYAYDAYCPDEAMVAANVKPVHSAEELYKTCDIVSLHIPATAETKNSINHDLVNLMPKGGVLVNTARKEVIDEEGLIALLQERTDLKYITDIMPVADAKFRTLFEGRYFATPKKMGAQTAEANINAGIAAAKQIVDFIQNGNTRFQVNK